MCSSLHVAWWLVFLLVCVLLPSAALHDCERNTDGCKAIPRTLSKVSLLQVNASVNQSNKAQLSELLSRIPALMKTHNYTVFSALELGKNVKPKDTECVVFSSKDHHEYYVYGSSDFQVTFESSCPSGYQCLGAKCSGYKYWTMCNNDWCTYVNALSTSACDYNIRSYKCGSNAQVKLCKDASRVQGRRRRNYYNWVHSNCITSEWGQDKKNLGGGYDYYTVTSRNMSRRRRSRRRRRRRTFLGIR